MSPRIPEQMNRYMSYVHYVHYGATFSPPDLVSTGIERDVFRSPVFK